MKNNQKKENKKIAITTGYFIPHLGGVERYVENLSKEFNKMGYEVVILTSNHNNSEPIEVLDYAKIYRLPIFNLFKDRYPILKFNNQYKKMMKQFEEENFDAMIVNTRFNLTTLAGAKIAKKINKKVCLIEHGTSHFTVNNKFLDFLGAKYEHVLTNTEKKYIDEYYAVSKNSSKWLRHYRINSNGEFYNSINDFDYEIYKNSVFQIEKQPDEIFISYAGRIIKEKGVENLIIAFNELIKKHKNIKLFIAGDGILLDELIQSNNNSNIKFLGKLNYNEVMALYNVTDIFTHPSMYPEGLPTSILEAGLMKTAIVATDRGGTKEVLGNDENGLIVEETAKDLEGKIDYLLNNVDKINYFKEQAHKVVIEKFSWKENAKKIIEKVL